MATSATWTRRRQWFVAVSAAAAVAAGASSVTSWSSVLDDRRDAEDRDAVLQVSQEFGAAVVNVSSADIENDLSLIRGFTTGDLADSLKAGASDQAAVLKQLEVVEKGTVSEAGVRSIDGEKASALVSLRTTQSGTKKTTLGYRMRVELLKRGDTWKVSAVEFVS